MSVYNDMANDAGYRYGSDENAQLAAALEEEHRMEFERQWQREQEERMRQFEEDMAKVDYLERNQTNDH